MYPSLSLIGSFFFLKIFHIHRPLAITPRTTMWNLIQFRAEQGDLDIKETGPTLFVAVL